MPPTSPTSRLSYIDWLRGLACLLMFQTHCYDSWLRPDLHDSALYKWSQLGGTLPAPLFIFLAGISMALVTERLREKGIARNTIAKQTIFRGAEIFALGILFRLQEYALGYKWVPWTDLFRVDILNILGLSMILMALLCWLASAEQIAAARTRGIVGAFTAATLIAMLTPPLWTTARASSPGPLSPTSTASTFFPNRSTGSSRSSPGPHSLSLASPSGSLSTLPSPAATKPSSFFSSAYPAQAPAASPASSTNRPSISTPSTTTGIPIPISSSCAAAFSSSSSSSSTLGAAGDSRKSGSALSFNSAPPRFSSIGSTSSSSTGASPSCPSAGVPFPKPHSVYARFF